MEDNRLSHHYSLAPFISANLRASNGEKSFSLIDIPRGAANIVKFEHFIHASVEPCTILCNFLLIWFFFFFLFKRGHKHCLLSLLHSFHFSKDDNTQFRHWLYSCQLANSRTYFSLVCMTNISDDKHFTVKRQPCRTSGLSFTVFFGNIVVVCVVNNLTEKQIGDFNHFLAVKWVSEAMDKIITP